jgi:DNA-binding GntR family transcriptional regulator
MRVNGKGASNIGPLTDLVLADQIANALRQAIFTLELPPETPLVERELSERFGVSKSPVRDALQRLAGEGLVQQTAHRGTSVRRITTREADEIYAVREVLESWAAETATPLLEPADLKQIRATLLRSRKAIDRQDRVLLSGINRDFHNSFAEATGNQLLAAMLLSLGNRVRIISIMGWQSRPSMEDEYRQHEAILQAAEAGDGQLAGRRMRDHIHEFRTAFQGVFEDARSAHGGIGG